MAWRLNQVGAGANLLLGIVPPGVSVASIMQKPTPGFYPSMKDEANQKRTVF